MQKGSFMRVSSRMAVVMLVAAVALAWMGAGSASADAHESGSPVDQLAIQRQLVLYADSLDWPRGATWPVPAAATYNPADSSTWPAGWAEGTQQFYSIFTDDAVVDYPSFRFRFSGKDNRVPTWNGTAFDGGIGYMFNAWNMASQTESHTILSNIIVTVNGNEATTKDRFSHNGYLTAQGDHWENLSYTAGFHEGKWRKEDGVWRCYYWRGTVQFSNAD